MIFRNQGSSIKKSNSISGDALLDIYGSNSYEFTQKDKEEIFKSYVNFDGNLTYLIDYFEKYRKFLSKKPFHFFTKGVIKNNF